MRYQNPHYLTPIQQEGYLALFGLKGKKPESVNEACQLAWPEKISALGSPGLKSYIFKLRHLYFKKKFLPVFLRQIPVPKGNEAFYRRIWESGLTEGGLNGCLGFAGRRVAASQPRINGEKTQKSRRLPVETDEGDNGNSPYRHELLGPELADDKNETDDDDETTVRRVRGEDEDEEVRRLPRSEANDHLRTYLREIGRIPLLKPEEERKLASVFSSYYERRRRLEALKDELENLRAKTKLTRSNRRKLTEINREINRHAVYLWQTEHSPRYARIMEAKERFIAANLRLVVSVAKRYSRFASAGYDFKDIIQAGNFGLMTAVERFTPERGFKFSTYGTWWIRQSILRFIMNTGETVRLPVHMAERVGRERRVVSALEQRYGRVPDGAEISEALNVSNETYQKLRTRGHISILQLDQPINREEDSDSTLADFIGDQTADIGAETDAGELRRHMHKFLMRLGERERKVVCYRWGVSLDGCGIKVDSEHTLAEIGKMLGVTRERIRQIQVKAEKRLQKMARRSPLKSFLAR